MKFTLRDLIWATLVVALLLVLGTNWIGFRRRTLQLRAQIDQTVAAELEARALFERAVQSEEVARVRANEAEYAQQQYEKQAALHKMQLKAEQQRLATIRQEIIHLEQQSVEKCPPGIH